MRDVLTLHVPLDWKELGQAGSALQALLEERDATAKGSFVALLVLEEVGTNILKYAYADQSEAADCFGFTLHVQEENNLLRMRFEDQGQPFDPTQKANMEQASIEETAIGGRGLMLVQRMSTAMRYQRSEDGNLLEVDVDLSA